MVTLKTIIINAPAALRQALDRIILNPAVGV
jgi:hypothetical protein